jgi:hypothetical protein
MNKLKTPPWQSSSRRRTIAQWLFFALAVGTASSACAGRSTALPRVNNPQAALAAGPFYTKHLSYGPIRIAAHASVPDEALVAARAKLGEILGRAPRLLANLESHELELHLLGIRQFPSDLPENSESRGVMLAIGQKFDQHMRGGHFVDRFVDCTEGSLLGYVNDAYFGEEVCAHEIGHAIHELGLGRSAWDRLHALYASAAERRQWISPHASLNTQEYFAEATRLYFTQDGRWGWFEERLARGREWLRAKDPEAFAFVDSLYTNALAPGAFTEVTAMRTDSDDELRSPDGKDRVTIVVRSRLDAPVEIVWKDHDGKRDMRPGARVRLQPDQTGVLHTIVGHVFVAVGGRGEARCTFTAEADSGHLLLSPATCGWR